MQMLQQILNLNFRLDSKNWKEYIHELILTLSAHQKFSGKKLQYFDPETNESYVPYVVETSIGLDRTFLAILSNAYNEEKLEDGSERVVLKIPPMLAPIKIAVLPLGKERWTCRKKQEK